MVLYRGPREHTKFSNISNIVFISHNLFTLKLNLRVETFIVWKGTLINNIQITLNPFVLLFISQILQSACEFNELQCENKWMLNTV